MKDIRIKQLMADVGMPESRSIYNLILQVENETQQGWKDLVRSVIDGSVETVDLPNVGVKDIEDFLHLTYNLEFDIDDSDGESDNYWLYFIYNDIQYDIEGSWYFGKQKISKT